MRTISRAALAASFASALLVAASPAYAADVIADFCSSPAAQADAQARQECAELQATQAASAKIKSEKDSIATEVAIIDSQIKVAEQKIKVQNSLIASLSKDIGAKSQTVNNLQAKIDAQTKSIESLIQKVNDRDSISPVAVLLGSKQFSDFYTEADTFTTLNRELTALINDVKSSKAQTEVERQNLEDRKERESDAKAAIEEQRRLIDRKKAEKNALLANKTVEYNVSQTIVTNQKAKVASIRSKLFQLQDGEGIPFGDAYDYAVKASLKTGVRPAFVLGILMQESSYDHADSSFGKNVGQCYVRDATTGAGVGANTGTAKIRVMSPTRDIPKFQSITSALGRDWTNTRVSCWIPAYSKGQAYGWGGAMGPAQFIPSTWDDGGVASIENRTAKALGIADADPWKPEHAIMAASLFLADRGAGLQTYSAEKNAACQYYSGKKCASSTDGNSYGNSVMKWVNKIQEEMIDPILGK